MIFLLILFIVLGIESIIVFLIAISQGISRFIFTEHYFYLDEISFRILVSSTLLQITYMLQVAVKHLFPNKNI